MACCLMLFDDSPIPDDPKSLRPQKFQISLTESITKGQPVCCLTYILPCCMNYYIRSKVLDHKLHRYSCCQGYMDFIPCFRSGMCQEKACPECCLCIESFICLGPSMSSSRQYIMDMYDLRPDPCDNQLVRFTNCMMGFACLFDILSHVFPPLKDVSRCLAYSADIVFYSTLGCMAGQIYHEVEYQQGNTSDERQPIVGNQNPSFKI